MAHIVKEQKHPCLSYWYNSDFSGCGNLRTFFPNQIMNALYTSHNDRVYEGIVSSRLYISEPLLARTKVIRFQRQISTDQVKFIESLKEARDNHEDLDYKKLKLTNIGIYSASKKKDLDILISFLKKKYKNLEKKVIIDGNGGVGNTTLFLSYVFGLVISVEIMKIHADLIKNNMKVYNRKNVKVMNYDFFDIALNITADFIIFDLPWGGTNYKNKNTIKLGYNNVRIACVINKLLEKKNIKKGIILFCPYNFTINNFMKKINSKKIKRINLGKHYWIIIN